MDTKHEYLIIGGGLAGASAIEGIREIDRSGSILLIDREPDEPYDRPPLSKQVWFGKKKLEDVFLHERRWYADNGVELLLGQSVSRIDPDGRTVDDYRGDRHRYRKLLLATGGVPRRLPIPGGDDSGLCYFRTLADFRRTREAAKPGAGALVIGGGFIGSELAAALCHAGATVTMVFPEDYLCHRVFPEGLGRFVDASYRERGIRVLNGDVPISIAREKGKFLTKTQSGQQIQSDLVIVGIGIAPPVELARNAKLKVSDGIEVDERLRTSRPEIFAAGDAALFPSAALGRRMRVEHWDNAVTQGKHAGQNLAGADLPYLHLPYFFSDLFEFGYEAVGEIDSRLETFADWEEENQKGVIYYLAKGKVRGAMMCNIWDKVEAARELVRSGRAGSPQELRGAIR